jgi:hypothetical protein
MEANDTDRGKAVRMGVLRVNEGKGILGATVAKVKQCGGAVY